jgi:hypothetical protein
MDPFRLMILFVPGAFGVMAIATVAYLVSGYRPEMRFTLVASLLLLTGLFALVPLASMRVAKSQASSLQRLSDRQAGDHCVFKGPFLNNERRTTCQEVQ